MDLDVVFLGTAGSMPTAQRAPTALLVRRGGERLLFDCAEGTQRQLLRSAIGLLELREIFLTHYHADHYLGLPGMLKTFALRGRDAPADGLRAARLPRPVRRAPPDLRAAHVHVELQWRSRPGDASPATTTTRHVRRSTHGVSGVGYAIVEHGCPAGSTPDAAEALGIPVGPERGALQRGEAVESPDGRLTHPTRSRRPRPGRKLVIAATRRRRR